MRPRPVIPHRAQRTALHRAGAGAWCLGLMRWMLVLLLVVDQVGAPLHRHHHDSGIDALNFGAVALQAGPGGLSVVETTGHDEAYGHPMLAVRPAGETKTSLAQPDDDAQDLGPAAFALLAALSLALQPDAGEARPFDRFRPPAVSVHRSLPPAGRAPPLHA